MENNNVLKRLIDSVQKISDSDKVDPAAFSVVEDIVSEIKDDVRIDEYVANGGAYCPVCDSNYIEAVGPIEADGSVVWQSCYCNDCKQQWTDHYKLITASFDDDPEEVSDV